MKILLPRPVIVIILLILLLLAAAILSLYGNGTVSWQDTVAVLTGDSQDETVRTIITELRIPRMTAALLCGAALGISGAILQRDRKSVV